MGKLLFDVEFLCCKHLVKSKDRSLKVSNEIQLGHLGFPWDGRVFSSWMYFLKGSKGLQPNKDYGNSYGLQDVWKNTLFCCWVYLPFSFFAILNTPDCFHIRINRTSLFHRLFWLLQYYTAVTWFTVSLLRIPEIQKTGRTVNQLNRKFEWGI